MAETWNDSVPVKSNLVYDDILDINENLSYLINRFGYRVDPDEADQGAAGDGNSVKDLVDAIGGTKTATIFFPHHADDGNTTTYAFSTAEVVGSNIFLMIQPGAIIDGTNLTVFSPANIIAAPGQYIFSTAPTYTVGGIEYPGWEDSEPDGGMIIDQTDDAGLQDGYGLYMTMDSLATIINSPNYVGLHQRYTNSSDLPSIWGMNPVVSRTNGVTSTATGEDAVTCGIECTITNNDSTIGFGPFQPDAVVGFLASYGHISNGGTAAYSITGLQVYNSADDSGGGGWKCGLWIDNIRTDGVGINFRQITTDYTITGGASRPSGYSDNYKWLSSGSGTNEYYLVESGSDGNPEVPDISRLTLAGSFATEGTVGSLNDHEWAYGDNDTLGYNTVYFRDDSGDPDVTAVALVAYPKVNVGIDFYNHHGKFTSGAIRLGPDHNIIGTPTKGGATYNIAGFASQIMVFGASSLDLSLAPDNDTEGKYVRFPNVTGVASAAAGSNGDVPNQVVGYLPVKIGATVRLIPYYATT